MAGTLFFCDKRPNFGLFFNVWPMALVWERLIDEWVGGSRKIRTQFPKVEEL